VANPTGKGIPKMATKKAKAKKATKANGKTSVVLSMLRRPNGVTRAQVLSMVDWQAVSFQQLARNAGVTLRVDKKERPYRYHVA
jgi:hypothetical protein